MRSRRIARIPAAIVVMVVALAGTGRAQSLAEVARKEAERRATVPVPGKVYTNDNLTPDFTKPVPPNDQPTETSEEKPRDAEAPAGTDASGSTIAPAGKPAADQDSVTPRERQEPQPVDDKDEAFWRTQAQLIRARLAKQNEQLAGLRAREASFSAGDASAERNLVRQTLQKAVADVEFLNAEWLRFERSARELKIPESWIR